MKSNFLISSILALLLLSSNAMATEYIYRDLMANTLDSTGCKSRAAAIKTATSSTKLRIYSKKFCQTQGYGWHVEAIKDKGKVACNECTDKQGLQKCHVEDVVVSCKRIKPGTVGMLPGKG